MKNQFKRNQITATMAVLAGVLMGFTALLQLSMGNPAAFMSLLACAICLGNGIWSFATPLVVIEDDCIYLKETPFRKREIRFSEIESIDMSNKRYIEIFRKNDDPVKIRFFALAFSDKEDFKQSMSLLK